MMMYCFVFFVCLGWLFPSSGHFSEQRPFSEPCIRLSICVMFFCLLGRGQTKPMQKQMWTWTRKHTHYWMQKNHDLAITDLEQKLQRGFLFYNTNCNSLHWSYPIHAKWRRERECLVPFLCFPFVKLKRNGTKKVKFGADFSKEVPGLSKAMYTTFVRSQKSVNSWYLNRELKTFWLLSKGTMAYLRWQAFKNNIIRAMFLTQPAARLMFCMQIPSDCTMLIGHSVYRE